MMTTYIYIPSLILSLRTRSFWEKVSKDFFLPLTFLNNKHITESKLLWGLCLKQLRIPQASCPWISQPPLPFAINQGSQGAEQPLSMIFSGFTLPPATTSGKKLVVICMLYCSGHRSSPSPWFEIGSMNHFSEQSSSRASPPPPRAHVEGPTPLRQTSWQSNWAVAAFAAKLGLVCKTEPTKSCLEIRCIKWACLTHVAEDLLITSTIQPM